MSKMVEVVLYMHAGSGNHGCEAIVAGLMKTISHPAALYSVNVEEDLNYSLKKYQDEGQLVLLQERHFKRYRPVHVLYYLYRAVTGDSEAFIRYRYHEVLARKVYHRFHLLKSMTSKKKSGRVHSGSPLLAISIGGDNYCYDIMLNDLMLMNRTFNRAGVKTVLLGCSVEPDLLKDERIVNDMLQYHTIIARESITYEALREIGHLRVHLLPDPAFALEKEELHLPDGFTPISNSDDLVKPIPGSGTIGINISPLIQANETKSGVTLSAYKALIEHIITTTDMQIALIPHVVWQRNDDRIPLQKLYDDFADSGRVVMIEDASAAILKGYISRLRFFVGARTHATIAAYSSMVPTLVIGYSVKARGIATDLFGMAEGYVVPVSTLVDQDDIVTAFDWLMKNETAIRKRLTEIIPNYSSQVAQIGAIIEKILNEQSEVGE